MVGGQTVSLPWHQRRWRREDPDCANGVGRSRATASPVHKMLTRGPALRSPPTTWTRSFCPSPGSATSQPRHPYMWTSAPGARPFFTGCRYMAKARLAHIGRSDIARDPAEAGPLAVSLQSLCYVSVLMSLKAACQLVAGSVSNLAGVPHVAFVFFP
jgi:hypothetical protein